MDLYDTMCCGGGELEGFNEVNFSPRELLKAYGHGCEWRDNTTEDDVTGRSWVVFSYAADVGATGSGYRSRQQGVRRLRAWTAVIQKYKLGRVMIMPIWRPNPNTNFNSELRAGIWQPNNRNVLRFLRKNYLLEESDLTNWRGLR